MYTSDELHLTFSKLVLAFASVGLDVSLYFKKIEMAMESDGWL